MNLTTFYNAIQQALVLQQKETVKLSKFQRTWLLKKWHLICVK